MTRSNVLEVQSLRKTYGTVAAVKNVSFEVRKGEVFGLLGKNGAGKTTIFEIILGLRRPDSGAVLVSGIDIAGRLSSKKPKIGALLQHPALPRVMRLYEIINYFAALNRAKVNAYEQLAKVGLARKARQVPHRLSGGERQRLAICVAMLGDPSLLLLDEPTVGLDVDARRQLWSMIRDLQSGGVTILLSTHYMEEAEQLCDRVGILREGELVAIGSPDRMIEELRNMGASEDAATGRTNLEDVFMAVTNQQRVAQ